MATIKKQEVEQCLSIILDYAIIIMQVKEECVVLSVREAFSRQICLDYCLKEADLTDHKNHFTLFNPLEGRRTWRDDQNPFLKAVCFNNQLFMTGQQEIIHICEENFKDFSGEWFMELKMVRQLNEILLPFGYQTDNMHPFFLPRESLDRMIPSFNVIRYQTDEIEAFRGDQRFSDAYSFDPDARDELGIAAVDNDGHIIGMAGASSDGQYLWQIGINVLPEARGSHVASTLVNLLSHDVISAGKIPFYGTALSHIVSQKVAYNAGFVPGWAELSTVLIK